MRIVSLPVRPPPHPPVRRCCAYPPAHPMRRITLAAAAIVLLGAAAAWFLITAPASDAPPEKYRFAVVDRGRLLQNVATTGTLNPVVLVNVGTQISGRIRRVLVDFNQPVRAGELLAELDSSLIEAQIAQLEANFEEMRTQLSVAQRKLERSEGLAARGFISTAQVEDEHQAVELAQARVRAIEAQVARERTNLAYTAIRSPIDGVVIARSVDVGQTVAASFQTPTLFLIARDLRDMQIDTNVAEARLAPQARSRIAEVLVAHDAPGGPPLRRQRATLGISDGTFTEVITGSGIAEGDRIAVGEFVQASNASARGGLRFRLF